MKKLLPHIIYIPIIAILILIAHIKSIEADKQSALAQVQSELAAKNALNAMLQAQEAERMAAESVKQYRIAEEALQKAEEAIANCNSKK